MSNAVNARITTHSRKAQAFGIQKVEKSRSAKKEARAARPETDLGCGEVLELETLCRQSEERFQDAVHGRQGCMPNTVDVPYTNIVYH
jgi:hypothetical protein